MRRPIDLLVIHCTASLNGRQKPIEEIRKEHRARGFSDVGYHYVIQADGSLRLGRPEELIGAHAAVEGHTYNKTSIGVCLVGGLLPSGAAKADSGRFRQAQWDTLRTLVRDLLTRYPGSRVVGHRDLSPDLDGDGQVEPCEWIKLCPTFDVSSWMAAGMVPEPRHIFKENA